MSRRLPRLEVIEAFIEAARAPSFRVAADRCHLSPAAFSRRIQAFTAFVGKDVFERRPGGMALSDAGRECLAALEPAYAALRRSALELEAEPAAQSVSLSLSHSLAVGWLIPRLARFREQHPHIAISIVTTRTAEAIRSGEADLGVCASDIDLDGLQEEHFLDIHATPIASPEIARAIRAAGGLQGQKLLTFLQDTQFWSWWSRRSGQPIGTVGGVFDMAQTLYEAAAAGDGVAPGLDVTAGPLLQSGRLEEVGLPWIRYPGSYRLAARPSRARAPKVAAVWSWLREEARRENIRRAPTPKAAVA